MIDPVFVVDIILLALVTITALAVVSNRHLFSATILTGIYSLLMALVWVNLHAMDVAFTEAAVGAGVSTILFLGALVVTGTEAKQLRKLHLPSLFVVIVTGGVLIYGTHDMPPFGDPASPVHNDLELGYIQQGVGKVPLPGEEAGVNGGAAAPGGHEKDASAHHDEHGHDDHHGDYTPTTPDFGHHCPNLVTAVLADYRGYDTMFETAVIFAAGISLLSLLGPLPRRRREGDGDASQDETEAS